MFGVSQSGEPIHAYVIRNSELAVEILEYGVRARSLVVASLPNPRNVIVSLDTLADYEQDRMSVGAVVGRCANRIRHGTCVVGDAGISLTRNHESHHLHGGDWGFARVRWQSEILESGVRFSRTSPAGEEGYPGNLSCTIEVRVEDNCLSYEYTAISDEDTIFNPTNHTYFDLSGSGDVANHAIWIDAEETVVTDRELLPTGELRLLEGTDLDLRERRVLGTKAFDDCYVLRAPSLKTPSAMLSVDDLRLSLMTTEPGLQFFTGDGLQTEMKGVCLESQHYPDSPNHSHFPSVILGSGKTFRSVTQYCFEVISNP